jgi:hypothetical protein
MFRQLGRDVLIRKVAHRERHLSPRFEAVESRLLLSSLLYDNGGINGTEGAANSLSGGWFETDSFTLSRSATFESATLGIWTDTGATPVSLAWSIGTAAFGSEIASGAGSLSNTFVMDTGDGAHSIFSSQLALSGTAPAGTYWLTLYNGTASSRGLDWDVNFGPSTSFQRNSGQTFPVYGHSFQIYGSSGTDLAATSLTWDTARGRVDYAYTISGSDLPKGATGALYWSTDSSFNQGKHQEIDGTGFTTAIQARTDPYTGHADAATLGTPPDPSYKYLLLALNSDDAVTESDGPFASDKNDVRAIPLQADLVMQKAVERSVMTLAVDYVINNAAVSQPLQFDIYRSANALTSGTRFTPGPDDIVTSSVVLPASDTPDLSIGSHTGVVLSLSSNLAPDPTRPFIIVVANPAGSNHFTESDESLGSDPNNVASFQLPDIRLDDVTTRDSSNAVIFQDFQVAYSIANSASPAFVLRAYLAPGPGFDAAQDQVLGQSGVSAPGMRLPNDDGSARSYTTVIHLNQPADVSARHYIIIVADPDAAIAETSKANNDLFAIPVLENTHAINRIGEEGSTSAVPEASTDASGRFIAPILRGTDEFSQLRSLDSVWSPSPLFGFDLYQDPSTLKGQEERLAQPSLLAPTQYLAALLVADQERASALWANVTFSINAAYDSTGGHHPGSLHYEGRALDIQDLGGDPNNRPERLGRIAGLAWLAGFDWSYVEPNDEKPPLTDAGAANHVHVSVRASIVPNVLAPIGDQSVVQGLPLILQANMSDPALALDQLVFTLQLGGASSGATIDPSSGRFEWIPTVRPGLYAVTIRVDDLSIPGLYSTRTFSITVDRSTSPSNLGHEVFVTALYNEVLGREPEPQGLFFWSKQLASKIKPRTVAISIWNSRERHILQGQHKAPPIRFNRALGDATRAWKQAIRL